MSVVIGLDAWVADEFSQLKGKSIGLLCNQAAVDSTYTHLLERLMPLHQSGFLKIQAVFGPQHGLFGHTQDNMIEWEAGGIDPRTGLTIFSLYGERREPTPKMLENIDVMVVDLPDIGSRYYTFAWTTALMIKVCGPLGIPVVVLDRPNPINGVDIEGPVLDMEYSSFVGLLPVRPRHGMTLGELAEFSADQYGGVADVRVVPVQGWDRRQYLDETNAPWMLPSPNMPTVSTAVVYPGACLLEATNLSEGRGTTKPFEIVGAPFLDGWKFADSLNKAGLEGVRFQPVQFEPTFNKFVGQLCEGVFVHVVDRLAFKPWITYIAILQEAIRQSGLHQPQGEALERFLANSHETALPGFAWKLPPYEYEFEKLPIDILAGNGWLRKKIENGDSLQSITSFSIEN